MSFPEQYEPFIEIPQSFINIDSPIIVIEIP